MGYYVFEGRVIGKSLSSCENCTTSIVMLCDILQVIQNGHVNVSSIYISYYY